MLSHGASPRAAATANWYSSNIGGLGAFTAGWQLKISARRRPVLAVSGAYPNVLAVCFHEKMRQATSSANMSSYHIPNAIRLLLRLSPGVCIVYTLLCTSLDLGG